MSALRSLLYTLCGLLAGVALFAIMMLTFVDVGGRKFLDTSLPGSLELTEMLMVVVIFAALPLVSLRGEHVIFDSLDMLLPAGVRRVQQALVDLLCAAMLVLLAWLMWDQAGKMAEYGDVTQPAEDRAVPVCLCDERDVRAVRLGAPDADAAAGGAPPRRRRGRLRMSPPAVRLSS